MNDQTSQGGSLYPSAPLYGGGGGASVPGSGNSYGGQAGGGGGAGAGASAGIGADPNAFNQQWQQPVPQFHPGRQPSSMGINLGVSGVGAPAPGSNVPYNPNLQYQYNPNMMAGVGVGVGGGGGGVSSGMSSQGGPGMVMPPSGYNNLGGGMNNLQMGGMGGMQYGGGPNNMSGGAMGMGNFNPFMGNGGDFLNSPLANYGQQIGQQLLQRQVEKLSWLSIDPVRYYFNVNNTYVKNKLKVLLCPCRHTMWKRNPASGGMDPQMAAAAAAGQGGIPPQQLQQMMTPSPPRDDINAPDLYIPTMAFITYILMIGYVMGTLDRFTPDVLGMTATSALVTMTLEVLTMRFGFYIFGGNFQPPPILDLVCYSGYKYVGIVLSLLIGLVLGSTMYYFVVIFSGVCMAYFISRTMKYVFAPVIDQHDSSSSKRKYFLVFLAVIQLPILLWLSRSAVLMLDAATAATAIVAAKEGSASSAAWAIPAATAAALAGGGGAGFLASPIT